MTEIPGSLNDEGTDIVSSSASQGRAVRVMLVEQLARPVTPMLDSATCLQALDRFHAEPGLMVVPVVDKMHHPVALVDRHTFVEFLGRMYSRELFGRRTLKEMLAEDTRSFPVSGRRCGLTGFGAV